MTSAKLATFLFALAAIGSAGCKGGIEGTYKLDKAEMKKSMEAEVSKLPADQQAFGKLAAAMIDTMDVTMELQAGGKLNMKATMPAFEPGKPSKTENKQGTWKEDGDTVVLDSGDGKPAKCSKSTGKLSCAPDKKGEPPMVFVKS